MDKNTELEFYLAQLMMIMYWILIVYLLILCFSRCYDCCISNNNEVTEELNEAFN